MNELLIELGAAWDTYLSGYLSLEEFGKLMGSLQLRDGKIVRIQLGHPIN